MRCFRLALILTVAVLVVPPAVVEAQPAPPAAREPVDEMTVEVVPLTYAHAGELAYTLSLVFPQVRIVPYRPTNSLIISGPRSSVEELIDIIKP